MELLFLSHCVPNPPDKGEKIRAFHELVHLAGKHQVHLVCFARTAADVTAAGEIGKHCASVYVETIPRFRLASAAVRFGLGACLSTSFFGSRRMAAHIRELTSRVRLDACLAYCSSMGQYAPAGVPLVMDFVDVDSEKWFQYAALRQPAFAYRMEAERLRRVEIGLGEQARRSLFATQAEASLFQSFAPASTTGCAENGVDGAYFDPARVAEKAELAGRRFVAFIGVMDYYPNSSAATWFAREVFPEVRRRDSSIEFFIVGRNPSKSLLRMAGEGITVTGSVDDVRPYLASAQAVVVPLRIARGIQNKVIEALAMGKQVIASAEVCKTFGAEAPYGIVPCRTSEEFVNAVLRRFTRPARFEAEIRQAALRRFSWRTNMEIVAAELEAGS